MAADGVGLSLLLKPRVNRSADIVVSLLYTASIIASCIGEEWTYFLLGSAVEVVLLLAIARTAWTWPPPHPAPASPTADQEPVSLWAG